MPPTRANIRSAASSLRERDREHVHGAKPSQVWPETGHTWRCALVALGKRLLERNESDLDAVNREYIPNDKTKVYQPKLAQGFPRLRLRYLSGNSESDCARARARRIGCRLIFVRFNFVRFRISRGRASFFSSNRRKPPRRRVGLEKSRARGGGSLGARARFHLLIH